MSTTIAPPRRSRPVRPQGTKLERAVRGTAYHVVSMVLAVAFLFPLLWAALNSIKERDEANRQPPTWFPESLSLENYRNLAGFDQGIGTYLLNSIAVSTLTVIGSVVVCVLGGYGFARFNFPGKSALFGTTLAILMVPYATILLPLYILLSRVGLQNTLIGLALVLIMFQLPFGIFMMRNSFE
ncbi:MAG TPA: carbohydrate ABC transporter permease, partial [Micromonosporaceae bacterium]|nr:carbohydrate ABC transporter permease [Micromonosporaceae bacterium]